MENIFVRELTVKAADEMKIYKAYRIRNEIWGLADMESWKGEWHCLD